MKRILSEILLKKRNVLFRKYRNRISFFEKLLAGDISFYEDSNNQKILDKLRKGIITSIFSDEQLSEESIIDMLKEFSAENTIDLKYEFNRFFGCNVLDRQGYIEIQRETLKN